MPFLTQKFTLDSGEAAFVTSAIYIGLGIGAPLSALLFAVVKSYRVFFCASSLISVFLFSTLLFYEELTLFILLLLTGSLGICLSPQILAFTLICRINPENAAATASGLHNTICMLSGIISQPLIGALIVYHAGNQIPGALSYSFGLFVIPVSLLISALLALKIKEP